MHKQTINQNLFLYLSVLRKQNKSDLENASQEPSPCNVQEHGSRNQGIQIPRSGACSVLYSSALQIIHSLQCIWQCHKHYASIFYDICVFLGFTIIFMLKSRQFSPTLYTICILYFSNRYLQCVIYFMNTFLPSCRWCWSVDILTAGMLVKVLWMMEVEHLFHGR